MTVFKTFLQIVKSYRFTIILYTVLLICFAGFNMQTNQTNTNFVSSKPDIFIINNDTNIGVTKNLVEYLTDNATIVELEDRPEAISDALFYRDVDYIISIPNHYRENFLKGLNPEIEVKSTNDYDSSLAALLLSNYLKVANIYQKSMSDETELINKINDTLAVNTKIEMTSKLDVSSLDKMAFYYNFLNYSMLAGCVYVICLILSSFKEEKITKRTIVSGMNDTKLNRQLLLCNGLLALILWVFYVILSFILIGSSMFTIHGLLFILNSFLFCICALTIAFLIGNLLKNKDAISGIINVVALGSSFLCGAFVPMHFLPDSVLSMAHILPSYWYIQNNEVIKTLEIVNPKTLQPILINMGVILLFAIFFVILTNFISRKKRKIA